MNELEDMIRRIVREEVRAVFREVGGVPAPAVDDERRRDAEPGCNREGLRDMPKRKRCS
jgi:hypothetical protein